MSFGDKKCQKTVHVPETIFIKIIQVAVFIEIKKVENLLTLGMSCAYTIGMKTTTTKEKKMDAYDKLKKVVDAVADGVWQQNDGGFFSYSQCAFCFASPQSEHSDDCPVKLARELRDELNLT